jgi:hypothetical protein
MSDIRRQNAEARTTGSRESGMGRMDEGGGWKAANGCCRALAFLAPLAVVSAASGQRLRLAAGGRFGYAEMRIS